MQAGHALQHRVLRLLEHPPQHGQCLRVLSQFRQRHGEQGVKVRQRGLELERSPERRDRGRKLALLEIHQAEPRVDLGDRGLLLPQLLVGAFRIRVPALSQRALACLVEPLRLTGRRRWGAGLRTRRDCIEQDADENPRPETFQIH